MTSVMDSSRRSGSSGPRPMISSVICSSIRTRSARVRARPSSSMTLPKISSIWRRTSTWLDRSSFGSRSWMTRLWIRNLTSRNDSRTGALLMRRGEAGGPPAGATGPPPEPPGVSGAAGTFEPPGSAPGRALSMRFSRDIAYSPSPRGAAIVIVVTATRTGTCGWRPSGRPPSSAAPGCRRTPPWPVAGCPGTPAHPCC